MNNDLKLFTNEPDATLLERFSETFENVRFIDILVGYFRTSGFFRLHSSHVSISGLGNV